MIGIIQARMESSRFPDKMAATIRGLSIIEMVAHRASQVRYLNPLVIATAGPGASMLSQLITERLDLSCFIDDRDPEDVLGRFVRVLDRYEIGDWDAVVRICGDNPLIVPSAIETLMTAWQVLRCDYLGFEFAQGQPAIDYPTGYFAEVIRAGALRSLDLMLAREDGSREHVTRPMFQQVERFGRTEFDIRFRRVPEWYIKYGPPDVAIDRPRDIARVEELIRRGALPNEVWP